MINLEALLGPFQKKVSFFIKLTTFNMFMKMSIIVY